MHNLKWKWDSVYFLGLTFQILRKEELYYLNIIHVICSACQLEQLTDPRVFLITGTLQSLQEFIILYQFPQLSISNYFLAFPKRLHLIFVASLSIGKFLDFIFINHFFEFNLIIWQMFTPVWWCASVSGDTRDIS